MSDDPKKEVSTEGTKNTESGHGPTVAYEWTANGCIVGIDDQRRINHVLVNEDAVSQALLEGAQAKARVKGLEALSGNDSRELRDLCAQRDEARRSRDAHQAEANGLREELVLALKEVADLKANNRFQRGYHEGEESIMKQYKKMREVVKMIPAHLVHDEGTNTALIDIAKNTLAETEAAR